MTSESVFCRRPDSGLYHTNMSLSLENLQSFVGGYIEVVPVGIYEGQEVLMICNEEGKFKCEKSFPVVLRGAVADVIYGSVVFCSRNGEEFAGLTGKRKGLETWLQLQGFRV